MGCKPCYCAVPYLPLPDSSTLVCAENYVPSKYSDPDYKPQPSQLTPELAQPASCCSQQQVQIRPLHRWCCGASVMGAVYASALHAMLSVVDLARK